MSGRGSFHAERVPERVQLNESPMGAVDDSMSDYSDDDYDDHKTIQKRPSSPSPPFPLREASPSHHTKPVAWRELPRKDQLFILTLARISEPIVLTSVKTYMFYQLKSFDPSLPDSTISSQAGFLSASFPAAQFLTAMFWGRIADSNRIGRKKVLLMGLLGTSVYSLAFGFSTSFWQALMFRLLGGVLNGNMAVARTMISEIIREKKYQSRAFLLMPMAFNIGTIIGPILGGILADPARSYPHLFGNIPFFVRFPYAAPNIISSGFLILAATTLWLGLEETHESLRDGQPDLGIRLGRRLAAFFRKRFLLFSGLGNSGSDGYASIPVTDMEMVSESQQPTKKKTEHKSKRYTQQLPFARIFTRNVVLTYISHFFLTLHMGTFNSLWFVFLSTPVWDPSTSKHRINLPFHFTGGLGLQPKSVGLAMAILGVIGIMIQLVLYPRISARLGTTRCLRYFMLCFPLAYFLMPYLSVIPSTSSSPPPEPKSGLLIWLAIFSVLLIQVTGRTFVFPSQVILINNVSPHPSVLGTIHGLGLSVGSGARTIGPMLAGFVFGFGLNKGIVGLVWWALSGLSVCGWLLSLLVRQGNGHEIWLEGDEEEPDESQR